MPTIERAKAGQVEKSCEVKIHFAAVGQTDERSACHQSAVEAESVMYKC